MFHVWIIEHHRAKHSVRGITHFQHSTGLFTFLKLTFQPWVHGSGGSFQARTNKTSSCKRLFKGEFISLRTFKILLAAIANLFNPKSQRT